MRFFPTRARTIRIAGILALLAIAPGCVNVAQQRADEAVSDYFLGDYPRAVEALKPAAARTDENFVLNNDRLGSAALAAYDLDTAESAFLRSYEVINSVGVNDGGRTLGAALVSENIKIWKGEPFERAMVNFYLGLVYYMRHDYANARGAFENALFKLRDYGDANDKGDKYAQVESNFALGYLMLAKSYQRLGRDDLAQKNFARVIELAPPLQPLADATINAQSNLLLVIDLGHGPQKITNADGAFVGFGPTPRQVGWIPLPVVTADGNRINVEGVNRPPVDLLALAQDRRWESIDTIRAVKSVLGTGLIGAGVGTAVLRDRADPALSLGLIGAGLLLKATSQADTRQWEMLPRTTFVLPLRLPPGTHDVTVEFPGPYGLRQQWHGLVVPPEGEATYYMRMNRYNPGPFNWPPASISPAHVESSQPVSK
jgi:tetratricopeptide (TPR) repeat protein